MRHLKLIWLAVLAAFASTALLAVAASGASAAEPEWGHCVPAKKGFYEDSNCTKRDEKKGKPKGKYEWDASAAVACYEKKGGLYKNSACTEEDVKKGVPKGKYEKTGGAKFEANGGAGVLTSDADTCVGERSRSPIEDCPKGGKVTNESPEFKWYYFHEQEKVECSSEHATGEAVSTDEVANVSVRFKGCSTFGLPATSSGLPAGEIQLNTLKGKLGYIDKATHEVGVLLEPVVAKGEFVQFEILEGESVVHVGEGGNSGEGSFWEETGPGVPSGHDGVISPITPVDHMTHTFTQDYRIEAKVGVPAPCAKVYCWGLGEEHGETGMPEPKNIPSHFEGGELEVLEDYLHGDEGETTDWAAAGEEVTNVNTVEGEAEIKG